MPQAGVPESRSHEVSCAGALSGRAVGPTPAGKSKEAGLCRGRSRVTQAQQSHTAKASATLLGIVVELGWPFSVALAHKMLGVGCPLQRGVTWHQTTSFGHGQSQEGGSPESHQLPSVLVLKGIIQIHLRVGDRVVI